MALQWCNLGDASQCLLDATASLLACLLPPSLYSSGGNGIASALPVFEELSASGVATQGLPALLLWACRKGYEFEFMAAPVLAAAQALGLNLTVHLYITGKGNHTAHQLTTGSSGLA